MTKAVVQNQKCLVFLVGENFPQKESSPPPPHLPYPQEFAHSCLPEANTMVWFVNTERQTVASSFYMKSHLSW